MGIYGGDTAAYVEPGSGEKFQRVDFVHGVVLIVIWGE